MNHSLSEPLENSNLYQQIGQSSGYGGHTSGVANKKNGVKRDRKKTIGKNKTSILKFKKKLTKQSSLYGDENDLTGFMRMGGIGKLIRGH